MHGGSTPPENPLGSADSRAKSSQHLRRIERSYHVVIRSYFEECNFNPNVNIRPENDYGYGRGGLPYRHTDILVRGAIRLKT